MSSKKKILVIGDSLNSPTGFSKDGAFKSWCLAREYSVFYIGLQTQQKHIVKIDMGGDVREVTELPNIPRAGGFEIGKEMIAQPKYDFGTKSLPRWMDEIKPDLLFTLNDIQMIQHVPSVLYRDSLKIKVMDLPQKRFLSDEAIRQQLEGELLRFKEKYPVKTRWILAAPMDGHPPVSQWKQIYDMADQVVAFTKYGRDVFRKYFGMNVPYIYHGVNIHNFKPMDKQQCREWYSKMTGIRLPPDAFIIGDLNRNQPRKQPGRLIRAFAKFAKDKPNVYLHMQMDWHDDFGWDLDYLGRVEGIRDRMLPPLQVGMPSEYVAKIYNMWDITGTAQCGEGFGLVPAESIACGTPVVATRYTTMDEILIEGEPSPRGKTIEYDTLFWDRFDVAASQRALINENRMAEAFQEYYDDRELLQQHGQNGVEWVRKNLSPEVLEPKWLDIVEKTLNKED